MNRFYSKTPISGPQVIIADDQAHHIRNVMRMQTGQQAILFDGSGSEWQATIEEIERRKVSFRINAEHKTSRELPVRICIASALPKGDRIKVLIEKLVELGVHRFVPINSHRSVVQANPKTLGRMEKYVIESCKQCGRNLLMQVAPPLSFPDFISSPQPGLRLIAQPGRARSVSGIEFKTAASCQFLVGPEGGFTEQEISAAEVAGWQPVSVGPIILRIETAAIALATLAAAVHWEEPA